MEKLQTLRLGVRCANHKRPPPVLPVIGYLFVVRLKDFRERHCEKSRFYFK